MERVQREQVSQGEIRARLAEEHARPEEVDEELWQEYLDLVAEVSYHDYCYYTRNRPKITDAEYDKLYRELEELEREYPELVIPDSPTRRIGSEVRDELPTVEHRFPLLSLQNAFDFEEVDEFIDRVGRMLSRKGILNSIPQARDRLKFECEYKIDGVSVALHYEDSCLAQAVTRGDGHRGDDVTHNIRQINSLHQLIPFRDVKELYVRGEVYISKPDFKNINQHRQELGKESYANPRNLAAGSLRQLDSSIAAQRNLDFFAYEILNWEDFGLSTQTETIKMLNELGFPVNEYNTTVTGRSELLKELERFEARRDELDYEVDGVVININRLDWVEDLGATAKSPRGRLAYKFEVEQGSTTIKDVEWSLGRTGVLTPIALLEPVQLGGTTVQRASMHNLDQMQRLGLLRGELPDPEDYDGNRPVGEFDVRYLTGVEATVQKKGDIIPQVLAVDPEGGEEKRLPRYWKDGEAVVEGGDEDAIELELTLEPHYLFLPSRATSDRLRQELSYWSSRECMDIEGLGEKTIDKLVGSGVVSSIPDLYKLKVEQVEQLEGFAEQSAQNLIKAIDDSRDRPFYRVLTALGIPGVGSANAQSLTRKYRNISAVLEQAKYQEAPELSNAHKYTLEDVEGIGADLAGEIIDFFTDKNNLELIQQLQGEGLNFRIDPEVSTSGSSDFFEGKTVVITGSVEGFTRGELQRLVELNGGNATSSVSGNTDLLIVGENPGSKLDDAQELGTEIMDTQALHQLLESEDFVLDEEVREAGYFSE